jgi:thiol-disulfide isomerase/thioredoxin
MKKVLLTFVAVLTASFSIAQAPAKVVTPAQKEVAKVAKPTVKTVDAAIVNGDAIMREIIKQNSKKVLLVDFWATWCGPCRMAMKKIDEIKPELTKKDCIFVYITGESSPLDKWEAMISNIEGVHYRLTNKQWGAISQHYGLLGIPSYMVINKDGSVAYDNFKTGGYPGSDVLQNEVEVALTK